MCDFPSQVRKLDGRCEDVSGSKNVNISYPHRAASSFTTVEFLFPKVSSPISNALLLKSKVNSSFSTVYLTIKPHEMDRLNIKSTFRLRLRLLFILYFSRNVALTTHDKAGGCPPEVVHFVPWRGEVGCHATRLEDREMPLNACESLYKINSHRLIWC